MVDHPQVIYKLMYLLSLTIITNKNLVKWNSVRDTFYEL